MGCLILARGNDTPFKPLKKLFYLHCGIDTAKNQLILFDSQARSGAKSYSGQNLVVKAKSYSAHRAVQNSIEQFKILVYKLSADSIHFGGCKTKF